MLGHLRLQRPVAFNHFNQATGIDSAHLTPMLDQAEAMALITRSDTGFVITDRGALWLDDLTGLFLPRENST